MLEARKNHIRPLSFAAGALSLLVAALRLPRRPALSCARAAGGHRAELQGVDRQLPRCRRLEGGQPAGRHAPRQLVGGLQRSRTECAGRATQYQQPEPQGVFPELHGGSRRRSPRRAHSIGRPSPPAPSWNRSRTSGNQCVSSSATTGKTTSLWNLPLDVSWTPDFWGKIRNEVHEAQYAAQVSAADLEVEKLTEQASLAEYFFEIRGQDMLQKILDETVAADQKVAGLQPGAV